MMENKTKNLLSIPFALCLIGCTHAMHYACDVRRDTAPIVSDTEASSEQVRVLSGDLVEWSSISDRPKPQYLDLSKGYVIASRDGGVKFVPDGGTQPETICFGSLEEMQNFIQGRINDYRERNYGANLVVTFQGAVEAGTRLEGLKEEFGHLLAISLASRPDVYDGSIMDHFTSDDLGTLFMDLATAVGWDGLVHEIPVNAQEEVVQEEIAVNAQEEVVQEEIAVNRELLPINDQIRFRCILDELVHANRRGGDLVWDIVSKIPTMVFGKMRMGWILRRLVENGYADNVAGLMLKMPKEELLRMREVCQPFVALAGYGYATKVVDLIREKGISAAELMGMQYTGSFLVELARRGQGQFVIGKLREASKEMLLGACRYDKLLTELVDLGYAAELATMIQEKEISTWSLVGMLDFSEFFVRLLKHGQHEFVMNELRKASERTLFKVFGFYSLLDALVDHNLIGDLVAIIEEKEIGTAELIKYHDNYLLETLVKGDQGKFIIERMSRMTEEELLQVNIFRLLEPLAVPGYAADLAALIQEKGIDPSHPRYMFFYERDRVLKKIEESLGVVLSQIV